MSNKEHQRGMVLVFALWTLTLLVVFSIYIGIGVRQRMILVKRLESRSKLYYSAASGIHKAIMVIDQARGLSGSALVPRTKAILMNNGEDLSNIELNGATAEIVYHFFDKTLNQNKKQYGMIDEASKININFASKRILTRLFQVVLSWDVERAEKLALAIIDWRTSGDSSLKGFFSDEYYKTLKHPYAPKNASFEILDEALLVEGMDAEILNRLRDFITVYGDGRVNVNTVSFEVLRALGFDEALSAKLVEKCMGPDGIQGTFDDYVFESEGGFVTLLQLSSAAAENDVLYAEQLKNDQQFRVDTNIYSIEAVASIPAQKQQMSIRCVYDASIQAILYWQET